jgi:hypothetical protein
MSLIDICVSVSLFSMCHQKVTIVGLPILLDKYSVTARLIKQP